MGWASANPIFDRVAAALIKANVDDHTLRSVLGPLIDELQSNDWDTEDESLAEFERYPVIVEVFREHGITAGDERGWPL